MVYRLTRFALILSLLSTTLGVGPRSVMAADDWGQNTSFRPSYYTQPNNFQVPSYRSLDIDSLNRFRSPALVFNAFTLRLPTFTVPEFGPEAWSFHKDNLTFDSERRVESMFGSLNVPSGLPVDIRIENIKYDNTTAPRSFMQTITDHSGSVLIKTRTEQTTVKNPSYDAQYKNIQQNHPGLLVNPEAVYPAGVPPLPTKELVTGFKESWTLESNGQKISAGFTVNIQSYDESNRWVKEYAGSVDRPQGKINYTASLNHDGYGRLISADINIAAKAAPAVHVTWTAVPGQDNDRAVQLLRENLPIPLLAGPRTATRLNDVDVPEAVVQLDSKGTLKKDQLAPDNGLVNLIGQEGVGINVGFSAPPADSKNSFSIINGLRNLGYILTGRWGDVKDMRQQLTTMRDTQPEKFVLAAGFSDPSFMGIRDLRGALDRSKTMTLPSSESKPIATNNGWDRIDPAIRVRFDRSAASLGRAETRIQVLQVTGDKLSRFANVIQSEIKREGSQQSIEVAISEIKSPLAKVHDLTVKQMALSEQLSAIEAAVKTSPIQAIEQSTARLEQETNSFSKEIHRTEKEITGKVEVARFFLREFASMNVRAEPAEETGTRLLLGLNHFRREGKLSGQSFRSLAGAVAAEVENQGIKEAGLIKAERLIAIDQSLRSAPEALAEGAVKGDFIKEPNWWNIGGQVGASFTPAGVAADFRDLGAAFNKLLVSQGRNGKLDVSLAFVALVPVIGDGAKGLYKGIKLPNGIIESLVGTGKIGRTAVRFAEHGNDIARAAKAFENSSPAIRDAIKTFLTPGARRTEAEIVQLVKNGAPPPKILARIVVTDSAILHGTLSQVRPTIFTFAVDDIVGLNKSEILKKTGWPVDKIAEASKSDLSIALFEVDPTKFTIEVPTWNNVLNAIRSDHDFLSQMTKKGISFPVIEEMVGNLKLGINVDSKEYHAFRAAIDERFGINSLFSGKGFTKSFDGSVGVREWWVKPNDSSLVKWDATDLSRSILVTPWK